MNEWLQKPALIWDKKCRQSPFWDDDTLLSSLVETKEYDNGTEIGRLSYLTYTTLVSRLVHLVRAKLQELLTEDECMISDIAAETLSIPVAVAIPEGICLPLAITTVHALNEFFEIGHRGILCSVVLVPLEPTEGRDRLKHMLQDARPLLVLTASDLDMERMEEILVHVKPSDKSIISDQGLYRPKRTTIVDLRDMIVQAVSTFEQDSKIILNAQKNRTDIVEDTVPISTRYLIHVCERALVGLERIHLDMKMLRNRISHIVYTSGTTGMPKGCVSSFYALDEYLTSKNEAHDISKTSIVLLASALSFDPCLSDILATFDARATLAIASRHDLRENLASMLKNLHVSHVLCTPTLWSTLAITGAQPAEFPSLRRIVLGGEPIPKQIVRTWAHGELNPHCHLHATYGVTEACVYQTIGEVSCSGSSVGQDVGFGFPAIGIRICQEANQEQLVGVDGDGYPDGVGEVVLSGPQLDELSSYLNLPELSSKKFVLKGSLYCFRTGDRGYIDSRRPFHLNILGRIEGDGMVKFNGVRVEVGEIEAALVDDTQQYPVVVDCLVVARRPEAESDSSLATEILAYIVLSYECCCELGLAEDIPQTGALCTPSPLLTLLRERCNARARIIPSAFIILPRIPLSPTGKRDRRRAPSLGQAIAFESLYAEIGKTSSVRLREYGRAGFIVAEQIVDCLNLQPSQEALLTTSATFAMLGGDSLAATRVVRALYAYHKGVFNTRFLGGEYGVLEGPFAALHLLAASNLGEYVDWLDSHGVCKPRSDTSHTSLSEAYDVERDNQTTDDEAIPVYKVIQQNEATQLYDSLMQTVTQEQTNVAIGLLEIGADPNFGAHGGRLGKTSSRNERKKTFRSSPLHLACLKGNPSLVQQLLEKQTKFNSPDASGLFPLHLAAAGEHAKDYNVDEDQRRIECIELLLEAGVPLSMKDGNKQTVLHCAARAGHSQLLHFVMQKWKETFADDLEKQGSVDWRDRWYRTPVHWCVLNGRVDALAVLLEMGCSANPPKPKINKRSSAAIETPTEMCSRLYGSSELGVKISTLLGNNEMRETS